MTNDDGSLRTQSDHVVVASRLARSWVAFGEAESSIAPLMHQAGLRVYNSGGPVYTLMACFNMGQSSVID